MSVRPTEIRTGAPGEARPRVPLWLAIIVLLPLLAACRTASPGDGPRGVPARATMAGRVTGPLGVGPIAGRLVSAVEVTTGARYSTKTHVSGGFTLLVPPGRYRLEVALVRFERVVEDPGVLRLEPGDFESDARLMIGGAGLARRH